MTVQPDVKPVYTVCVCGGGGGGQWWQAGWHALRSEWPFIIIIIIIALAVGILRCIILHHRVRRVCVHV